MILLMNIFTLKPEKKLCEIKGKKRKELPFSHSYKLSKFVFLVTRTNILPGKGEPDFEGS